MQDPAQEPVPKAVRMLIIFAAIIGSGVLLFLSLSILQYAIFKGDLFKDYESVIFFAVVALGLLCIGGWSLYLRGRSPKRGMMRNVTLGFTIAAFILCGLALLTLCVLLIAAGM